MTDSFEVGEVAIIFLPGSVKHGSEVEITSKLLPTGTIVGPERYSERYRTRFAGHLVRDANNKGGWAPLHELRKKKPPKEDESWAAEQYRKHWQPASQPVDERICASHSVE